MPPDAVSVTRPGPLGNPFRVGWLTPTQAVRAFAALMGGRWKRIGEICNVRLDAWGLMELHIRRRRIRDALDGLRGRNLACWCRLCAKHRDGKPFGEACHDCDPCHADVLGCLANGIRRNTRNASEPS